MEFRNVVEIAKKGDMVIFTQYGNRIIDYVDHKALGWYTTRYNSYTSWSEKIAEFDCERVSSNWFKLIRLYFPIDSTTRPIDEKDVENIVLIPKGSISWIDKAYDWANINSEDDDCIWKAINKYKRLRELNDEQQRLIYDLLAERLGYKTT